jgi:ATP-binding cassette subfamily B (MDR/TAP) protein 1
MRNILGRFAGNLLNAAVMLGVGVIGGLVVGWELTLVGLSLAPIIYLSTKLYISICDKWERVVVQKVENSTMVLHEATRCIRTVVGLCVEEYFEKKFAKEVVAARTVATSKLIWVGAGFGFIEAIGYFSKGNHLVCFS